MTKLHHFDGFGTARFVTFSTYRRVKYLEDDRLCVSLADELVWMRRTSGVKIYGYVFMPDHVHLVLHPPDECELGVILGQVKGRSSFAYGQLLKTKGPEPVWQRRCYDHNCRTPVATREKIEYCHKNPVSRGLVQDPAEWRWSSHNWYNGLKEVPFVIDSIEAE